MQIVTRIARRLDWLRLVRFGIVGLGGVVVNLVIVQLLFGQLHWAEFSASAIASELAVVSNFFWNNRWTFGQRTVSPARFARFNLTSLGGILITSIIFTVLVKWLSVYYLLAQLVGIGAATSWNFVASVFWTWAP